MGGGGEAPLVAVNAHTPSAISTHIAEKTASIFDCVSLLNFCEGRYSNQGARKYGEVSTKAGPSIEHCPVKDV